MAKTKEQIALFNRSAVSSISIIEELEKYTKDEQRQIYATVGMFLKLTE